MGRRTNPALLGAFVVGALALTVAGLVVFGGGKFFRPTQRWVAYFDESIKGLAIGAPVTFRGVRVGTVKNIAVVVDRKTLQGNTPVVFEIEADRILDSTGKPVQLSPDREGAKVLFARGLRAQLEMQSFVTGQLAINLDFHPDASLRLTGIPSPYPEMPTVPSTVTALRKSFEEMNLGELADDVRSTVKGIERLVNSPEVQKMLASASLALEAANRLVTNADNRVTTLGPALERTSQNLNETLDAIRKLAASVNAETVPAATDALKGIQQLAGHLDAETVPAATDALKGVQQLAGHLDAETVPAATRLIGQVQQLAEDFEKTSAAARLALGEVQKLAATADASLQDNSTLRYQLDDTLREMSSAARAFRALASYLERYPESVVFGKGGK